MNGSINYIITVNVLIKPIVVDNSEPELKSLHASLLALSTAENGGMEILDVKRCVISASGKVIYTQAVLTFDQRGMEIRDVYGNLLDAYNAPEPGPKHITIRRFETWANDVDVDAVSVEDAKKIVDQMVTDGEFDVLDGCCTDVWYEVIVEGESE